MPLRIVKHTHGTPQRGEVREFYRQLAQFTGGRFVDGAGALFMLRLPSGKTTTLMLGGTVPEFHRNLDAVIELLNLSNLLPVSPYPDQHTIP